MLPSEEGLQQLNKRMDDLATESLSNEEYIPDVPFTLEEVAYAVKKLKSGKACGPDGISAEHLKLGGKPLLQGIVNSIIDMEEISSSFKPGSICPAYKGGGDLLQASSLSMSAEPPCLTPESAVSPERHPPAFVPSGEVALQLGLALGTLSPPRSETGKVGKAFSTLTIVVLL